MIDKNFYLENLTAFDTLIETDRIEAEKAIYKVYCILQRDKYWLHNVATPEEIDSEDAELLEETEAELNALEEQYGFRFAYFHKLVMEEMQKGESGNMPETVAENELHGLSDENLDGVEEDEDFDFYTEDEFEDEPTDHMGDFSDEELNLVVDYVLNSAKQKFDYDGFLSTFQEVPTEFLDDHVLLYIIARKAYGEPEEDIAEALLESFESNGFEVEIADLLNLTETFGKKLGKEILAFGIAMDSLQQGTHPVDVVAHISDII